MVIATIIIMVKRKRIVIVNKVWAYILTDVHNCFCRVCLRMTKDGTNNYVGFMWAKHIVNAIKCGVKKELKKVPIKRPVPEINNAYLFHYLPQNTISKIQIVKLIKRTPDQTIHSSIMLFPLVTIYYALTYRTIYGFTINHDGINLTSISI